MLRGERHARRRRNDQFAMRSTLPSQLRYGMCWGLVFAFAGWRETNDSLAGGWAEPLAGQPEAQAVQHNMFIARLDARTSPLYLPASRRINTIAERLLKLTLRKYKHVVLWESAWTEIDEIE